MSDPSVPPLSPPPMYAAPLPPAFAAPAGMMPGVVDAGGVVVVDLSCRKCQYNLRGLSIDGRCPECGTPVGFSAQGDLLRFCDPDWVDTPRRGVNFVLGGVGIIVVGAIVGAVMRGGRPPAGGTGANLDVSALIILLGDLMMVGGSWFLTTPDPSGLGEERYGRSRVVIRVALIVGLCNQAIQLIIRLTLPPPSVMQALLLLSALAGIVGLVGQFAMLLYLSKLAMRIPDPALSSRASVVMWGIGVSYGMILLMGIVVGILASQFTGPGSIAPIGCIGGIAGLALIVFGVMYLLLLEKLGKSFKAQSALARATWAAAGEPRPG